MLQLTDGARFLQPTKITDSNAHEAFGGKPANMRLSRREVYPGVLVDVTVATW